MNSRNLRIWVEDEINGKPISPEHVPLGLLRKFTQDVERLLKGSAGIYLEPIAKIENGSLALECHYEPDVSFIHDMMLAEASEDVSGMDTKRAEVITNWQRETSASSSRKYHVRLDEKEFVVNSDTRYFTSESGCWVKVTRKIYGKILAMGGKTPNIHVLLNNETLVIASDQKTLSEEKENWLYKYTLLTIKAEENIDTGDLRKLQLISFEEYSPSTESMSFQKMQEAGTLAWNGVKDAAQWVRGHRGE